MNDVMHRIIDSLNYYYDMDYTYLTRNDEDCEELTQHGRMPGNKIKELMTQATEIYKYDQRIDLYWEIEEEGEFTYITISIYFYFTSERYWDQFNRLLKTGYISIDEYMEDCLEGEFRRIK